MSTVKTNNVQIGQSVTATNNFTWYQPATPDGTVRLGNGNSGSVTDLVTLTSAGNLGIGTSSPGAKLNVSGTVSGNSVLLNGSGTGANFSRIINTSGDAVFGLESSASGSICTGSTAYAALLYTVGSTPLQLGTASTVRATIDSSGNLGLGVTPSGWNTTALQFTNGASFSSLSGGYTFVGNNFYYNAGSKYIGTGTATLYQQNAGSHSWYTAPSGTAGNAISFTQAMTLDASGNLCLGKTSASDTVVGANIYPSGVFVSTLSTSTSATASYSLYSTGAANYRFYVDMGGTIHATSTTITAISSDERLKQNIVDFDKGLNQVLALRPRYFEYKKEPGIVRSGFIAQEVEMVMPEAIEPIRDDPEHLTYSIDWNSLLVRAIQELSAELNELKKRIN